MQSVQRRWGHWTTNTQPASVGEEERLDATQKKKKQTSEMGEKEGSIIQSWIHSLLKKQSPTNKHIYNVETESQT